jgi:hypothetical protein
MAGNKFFMKILLVRKALDAGGRGKPAEQLESRRLEMPAFHRKSPGNPRLGCEHEGGVTQRD